VPVNITNLKKGLSNDEYVDTPGEGKQYSLYKAVVYEENDPMCLTGISNVFTAQKEVNVCDTIRIKFVIADVSDPNLDSFVMIKGDSLSFNKDTKVAQDVNNPKTGDRVLFYVSMLVLSIIGLTGTGLYLAKSNVLNRK